MSAAICHLRNSAISLEWQVVRSRHNEFLLSEESEGLFGLDPEGNITFANPSAARMLGRTVEELLGKPVHGILCNTAVKNGRSCREPRLIYATIRDGATRRSPLSEFRRKDGNSIFVQYVISSVSDEFQTPIGALVRFRDTTEQIRERLRLEEQTTYLNALIENSPVAIVVLDSHHRVRMCNPAFERLFLYSRKELKGVNLDKFIAAKDARPDAIKLTRQVLAGQSVHGTSRRCRKDGRLVEVEIYGVPLIVKGTLVGVYGLYQDVTAWRYTERRLRELSGRILRSQDEERRRIARELHDSSAQSLAGLSMNLSELRRRTTSLDACKLLSDSINLAEQCAHEIRTLTYLLHPPLLDVVGLGAAVSSYAKGLAKRSGIRIELRVSSNLGRLPREFELALYRVVQESMSNVLRHSGSPVAKIHIALVSSHIRVEVKDQGRGMPPFRNQRSGGTPPVGVGIDGMRERLEQLGGRLEIISGKQGTTVRAMLPLIGGARHDRAYLDS